MLGKSRMMLTQRELAQVDEIISIYSNTWLYYNLSFIVVTMNSRDRYEIIGLCKISHSIKQPFSSICLKKALTMHQGC